MFYFLKNHLVLSAIGAVCIFLLWTLPAWLGSVWPLFTTKTIPQWISERRWLGMTPDFFIWFTVPVGISMVALLGVILYNIHQQKREAKQIEIVVEERNAARRTIGEIQAKLSTLESKQPHLKTEPYVIQRKLGGGQPTPIDPIGCFALLRVTNEPKTLNSQAIAYRLYAKVSYCNEQWIDLFPPVSGAWFSLRQSHGPNTIGPPHDNLDDLKPHQSAYLGIAFKYQGGKGIPRHALSDSSGEWPNWLNPDLVLFEETIYVKVTIGCHDFQTTDYYVLEEDPKTGFQLQSVSDPTSLSSGTS